MTKIAVSGASGQLGRLVVAALAQEGLSPIVALSRTPEKVVHGERVEPRFTDFDNPRSLDAALVGVSRLILISTDAIMEPGRRVGQHMAAIEAAERAGIAHIVYTSMLGADTSPLKMMVADHWATEQRLAASSLSYTILRHAFYDDLAMGLLERADEAGTFMHAAGRGRVAYVSRQQCAQAAMFAVSEGFGERRRFDITGPVALDMVDLANIAAEQRRRPYQAVAVSAEVLVAGLVEKGMPLWQAQVMAMIDNGLADGAMEPASDDFTSLTGQVAPSLRV